MFASFALRHVPPLLVASALTFGGLMPFFNAEYAILEFGLPARIAISKPAQSIMILSSARITAIGLALFTFYFQEQFAAVDTIMVILGYLGLIDAYVCWLEEVPCKAVFRFVAGSVDCSLGMVRHDGGAMMGDVRRMRDMGLTSPFQVPHVFLITFKGRGDTGAAKPTDLS